VDRIRGGEGGQDKENEAQDPERRPGGEKSFEGRDQDLGPVREGVFQQPRQLRKRKLAGPEEKRRGGNTRNRMGMDDSSRLKATEAL